MKSTRRLKICSVLGFLVCLVTLATATVSVGAIPIAGDTYPISMPTVNMTFAYRVFDIPLFEGEHHPDMKYSFYTIRVNSDIALNDDGRYEFLPYWSASTTFRYNGDDFNNMNLSFTQALNLNSISCEIDEFNGGFDYEQSVNIYSYLTTPMPESADLVSVSFTAENFYVYGPNFDDKTLSDDTPLNMRVPIPRTSYDNVYLSVVYSKQGQIEVLTKRIDTSVLYDDNYVYFNVDSDMLDIPNSELAFVYSATLTVSDSIEYETAEIPFLVSWMKHSKINRLLLICRGLA